MVTAFTVLGTSFYSDLLVNPQGGNYRTKIFRHFIQLMSFSNSHFMVQKLRTVPHSPSSLILILYPVDVLRICNSLAPQGALSALQRRAIPENLNLGKNGQI